MSAKILPWCERVRRVKQGRPDLANKDVGKTDNLDVDAFRRLFPLPHRKEANQYIASQLEEERKRAEEFINGLSPEERERLLQSGSGFMWFD
ncbi:hypothetical protein [Paraburkholderia sp. BCC1885]|jgi:DNA-directed RNA polymerase specialized sigma24 family protein|uniref:hypothetical protein n=1 Tax=Paraburkholderia sp. BCC1885 TaxID=2562669 RepID=UPI001181EC8A|nr:hypothetical protein [Paraburkholderia sp. BCC1885]